MTTNILITGAAGYIGGSIVTSFLSASSPLPKNRKINAAARSPEQIKALSGVSGVNVLQLDLTDEAAVVAAILKHEINIVIHTASSLDKTSALILITALARQKEVSGIPASFIHTSGVSAFYPKTGWPAGAMSDATGPLFETEQALAESYSLRQADVEITLLGEELGVTTCIVVPFTVYGKGSGSWNQLSIIIPPIVLSSLTYRSVSKFPEPIIIGGIHITDLTALYGLLVEKIVTGETIPAGRKGYYFAIAHDMTNWEMLESLSKAMKDRGLVDDASVKTWESVEEAGEKLGVPPKFVEMLWNAGTEVFGENARNIGWSPTWDKERFLKNVGDEIDAVLELGRAKRSLIDSLFVAARS